MSPDLEAAQKAYIALTGKRPSMTEAQRLQWRLEVGDSVADAVEWVHGFFTLHGDAMAAASMVEPGPQAIAAHEAYCREHGARYGY